MLVRGKKNKNVWNKNVIQVNGMPNAHRNLIFLTELFANKLKTYKFENCQMFAVSILEFSLNKEKKSKNLSIS